MIIAKIHEFTACHPEKVDLTEFQALAIPSEERLAFNSKPALRPVLTFSNGVVFFVILCSVTVMMVSPFNIGIVIEGILPCAYHIHII